MKILQSLFILLLCLLTHAASAANFIVDRIEDAPDQFINGVCAATGLVGDRCTLRAAIMEANFTPEDDVILIPDSGLGEFALTLIGENEDDAATGDLDIYGSITIQNFLGGFVIDGNGTDRIFHVMNGAELTLLNGLLTNGVANSENSFQGGAIKVEIDATLVVDRVEFSNNIANRGGAIFNDGDVTIENSHLHHNAITDEHEPFALPSDGNAILNRRNMLINASTLSHNGLLLSNDQGISINESEYAVHMNPNGVNAPRPLTLFFNSTIADNKFAGVRSIRSITSFNQSTVANHESWGLRFTRDADNDGNVQLSIGKSLFANNGMDCNDIWAFPDDEVNIVDNYNASTDESCGFTGNANLENINDPFNGSLGDWGGETPTLMLSTESPAIDFVAMGCSDQDQRGVSRPLDGDNDLLALCDIGAVEFNPAIDPSDSDIIFINGFEPLF